MKATETKCLPFLKRTVQFQIPIYQRAYSWTAAQCLQLWDDVVRAGEDEETDSHFVGSIVYVHEGHFAAIELPRLLVIDGQQRLTTLSLLIMAFAREVAMRPEAERPPEVNAESFLRYHLTNPLEDGEGRYKLVLTYGDRETLRRLIDGKPTDSPGIESSPQVVENLALFRDALKRASPATLAAAYRGLNKLMMIDVSLEREHDDPQLIFESLNSTGLALSQADLIRNYVLMGLDPQAQKELFEAHWQPMERAFGAEHYVQHFDRFVRHYLTMRTRQIPRIRQVYREFKAYVSGKVVSEVVADLHRFAGYYTRITGIGTRHEPDVSLRRTFKHLDRLQVDTALPFLLEVYDDYATELIDLAALRAVAGHVESYVVRRVLCDVPTNTLNKMFAALADRLDKAEPASYLGQVEVALRRLTGNRRFPGDAELREKLHVKDIYSLRTCGYILEKLENHGRKEPVRVMDFTIEHVLPQKVDLSQEWRKALGDDWQAERERWLHTLGNLTLTGYNSELSDRPFDFKRRHEGGFENSPLWLNRSIRGLNVWDAEAIQKRTTTLTDRALEVWPLPDVDEASLRRPEDGEGDSEYTLDDHQHLVGPVRELYELLHRQIKALDPRIERVVRKMHIAYVLDGHVVDVVVQTRRLLLYFDVPPEELDDPESRVRDMTGRGHWGGGDSQVRVRDSADLGAALHLIRQSYRVHGGAEGQ